MALALIAACGLAASASAQTFVVNTLADSGGAEECQGTGACTLPGAIERANEDAGADTIEFAVDGVIAIEGSLLPRIEGPVTIDATTAPGYSGAPVVEIDGTEANNEGPIRGLEIFAGPSTVMGLAVGNFSGSAIYVESADPVHVCGDHLGVDMTGEVARPNVVGVEVGGGSVGTEIGAACPAGQGNLISGNEDFGIRDSGLGTRIAANRIGTDAHGGPLGNGGAFKPNGVPAGAGVFVTETGGGTYIGPEKGEEGNTIAFNETTGVERVSVAENVTIGQNSIYSNTGLGIETVGQKPPVPSLATAQTATLQTTVSGALEGKAGEEYFVEFFGNDACDSGGAGEGRTPIGGVDVETSASGKVSFSVEGLRALPLGQDVVTATATAGNAGSTSEFSQCLTATRVAPKPPPGDIVLPVNGKSVALETVSGKILITPPGGKKPHLLGQGEIIPIGSIVDATDGRVSLTSIDDEGHTQTAVFYGGVFQVLQKPGSGLVVLRLKGGDFGSCADRVDGAGRLGSASATASRRPGRHLWGSGKGNFRTEGSHGSATVQGTIWFTEDRCDGTFFKVRRGVVTIRDFTKHRTLKLPKGRTYLAEAP